MRNKFFGIRIFHAVQALAALFLILANNSTHAKDYTINVLESWQTPQQKVEIEATLTHLYAPLGITPSFVYYPSQRGLLLVSQGELDAEASRYPMVAEQYPNLVKVPESIGEFDAAVFCLTEALCQSFKDATIVLKSGFESGLLYCEQNQLNCKKQENFNTLSRLLKADWGVAALLQTQFAHEALCQLEQEYLFYRIVPELRSFSYHYVNKRHQKLIAGLDSSIKAFKRSQGPEPASQAWQNKIQACGKKLIETNH